MVELPAVVVVMSSSKSLIHTGDPDTASQLENISQIIQHDSECWLLPHVSPSVALSRVEDSTVVPGVRVGGVTWSPAGIVSICYGVVPDPPPLVAEVGETDEPGPGPREPLL